MARPKRIPDCHSDRVHKARGLCQACYDKIKSDPVKQAEYQRNYYRAHSKELTERYKDYRAKWQKDNRESLNARRRGKRNTRAEALKYNYGVDQEWYEAMLVKQNNICAFPSCDKSPEASGKPLNIDHDHNTGKLRGLLCTFHNTRVLDISFHRAAIEYIESYQD